MADGGPVYDPMGNVTMPPEEGFAPSPVYESIADAMARTGAAVGRPITTMLRGAAEIPSTVGDYFAEKAQQPDPSQRIAEDIATFGGHMWEGIKRDPFGAVLDVLPVVGEIRSGMDAADLTGKAEEAEIAGDFDKARTFRQLAAVAVAGAAPLAGTAARVAKIGAKAVEESALKAVSREATDMFAPKTVLEAFKVAPEPQIMRDDIIAEITRSIDATDGTAAKLPTTAGLGPMYVVDSGMTPEGKGFLLNETKNANAEKQLSGIDPLFEKYTDIATDPVQWASAFSEATGKSNVLAPPYRFMKELAPGGDYENLLKTMTPGQISDRQKGFENGRSFLNAYGNGEMLVEDTGKLFMWGILSRGVDPFTHEGLFLDAFNGIEPWVKMAAEGKFTKEIAEGPYKEWAATVSPKGSGQAGSGAIHNLNAFGRDFLTKMGTPDANSVTPIQKLHELMSDPTKSGRQIRREFAKTGEGVGIDNKVVSFILLATGRDDVMVIDRIQLKNLWDDGRFGDVNIWDGISVPVVKMADGKTKRFPPTEDGRIAARELSTKNKGSKVENAAVTGSTLAEATYGAKGILVYEALENALTKSVKDVYARAGLNEANPTPGMFHWDTWVARSNQEASHGTLGAILSKRKGETNPLSDVYSKQGDYQTYAYGSKYGVSPEGSGFYKYPLSTGEEVSLSPVALAAALENVKNPKYGVVPKGFKVTETTGRPWYEREGVNRAKLDEIIRAAAESGGTGGQTQSPVRRASGGPVSDGSGNRAGAGGTGAAGKARLLKLAAEHGLHRPQIANILRQNDPRLSPVQATARAREIMAGDTAALHGILSDSLMADLRRMLKGVGQ
jgi:hypothetical protein